MLFIAIEGANFEDSEKGLGYKLRYTLLDEQAPALKEIFEPGALGKVIKTEFVTQKTITLHYKPIKTNDNYFKI